MMLSFIPLLQSGEEGTDLGIAILCFIIILACIVGFFNMK